METGELSILHGSAEIGELAGALAAAQAEFAIVAKDNTASVATTKGPAYTYKYADLASCLAAVRQPLAKHGLCVMQTTVPGGTDLLLRTILAHKSGQWIASDFPLISGDWSRPQAVGSAITYARRYTLCALLQIATDDDDGAAAQQQAEQRKPARQAVPTDATKGPGPYRRWLDAFCAKWNEQWAVKHPSSGKLLISNILLNEHLLKSVAGAAVFADEATDLAAGQRAWEVGREAMEAEATAYCRRAWKEAAAVLRGEATREPAYDMTPDATTAR